MANGEWRMAGGENRSAFNGAIEPFPSAKPAIPFPFAIRLSPFAIRPVPRPPPCVPRPEAQP